MGSYNLHMPTIRTMLILAAVTLLGHGVWEYLHIALYTDYGAMEGLLPAWVLATLGDLFYTLVIIAVVSLSKGGTSWVYNGGRGEYLAAALLGLLVALMVEYKGLYLGRWAYLPSMPVIPFLGVGLSPVLQMTVLTPLILFLTKRFSYTHV